MTRDNPSISVVMPTYDEVDRLCAALTSLSRQDYPTDQVEIIVVDDASPTPADAEKPEQALAPFTLKLLKHETNQGRARARNTGLRCATGDIIVFLDSDMTVESDFSAPTQQDMNAKRKPYLLVISSGDAISPQVRSRATWNDGACIE